MMWISLRHAGPRRGKAARRHAAAGLLTLLFASTGSAEGVAPGDYVVADDGLDALVRVDPVTGEQAILSAGSLLADPFDVAEETDGALVAACAGNGSIVRVDPGTGDQSLIAAGDGLTGPSGIDVLPDGTLVVADADARSVWSVDPVTGAVTKLSDDPSLRTPIGIAATDAGEIFVTDPDHAGGAAVLAVDPSDGRVAIVSQSVLLGVPFHLAVEPPGGTLVVADTGFVSVLRVNPSNGQTSTVASGVTGASGSFDLPSGVAVEPDGDLVVVDTDMTSPAVWSVDAANGLQTVRSTGPPLALPLGVAVVTVPEPRSAAAAVAVLGALALLLGRPRQGQAG